MVGFIKLASYVIIKQKSLQDKQQMESNKESNSASLFSEREVKAHGITRFSS
jgi:hypothetical protein